MSPFRSVLIFKLGAFAGMAAAAAFVRQALPSRGDEDSDELSLVAVFDGIDLRSRATAAPAARRLPRRPFRQRHRA